MAHTNRDSFEINMKSTEREWTHWPCAASVLSINSVNGSSALMFYCSQFIYPQLSYWIIWLLRCAKCELTDHFLAHTTHHCSLSAVYVRAYLICSGILDSELVQMIPVIAAWAQNHQPAFNQSNSPNVWHNIYYVWITTTSGFHSMINYYMINFQRTRGIQREWERERKKIIRLRRKPQSLLINNN